MSLDTSPLLSANLAVFAVQNWFPRLTAKGPLGGATYSR